MIPIDYWVSCWFTEISKKFLKNVSQQITQQPEILKRIVSLIEEIEIPVIFEISSQNVTSKFTGGVNIWDK